MGVDRRETPVMNQFVTEMGGTTQLAESDRADAIPLYSPAPRIFSVNSVEGATLLKAIMARPGISSGDAARLAGIHVREACIVLAEMKKMGWVESELVRCRPGQEFNGGARLLWRFKAP